MFLRRYTRIKDGKKHVYYGLVESVRTAAGPRQRVVAHLGELNHDQHRRWQRTVTFYNRQGDARQLRLFPEDESMALPDDPQVARVRLESVGWSNARRFGDVWLAWWLWRYVGLDQIIDRHLPQGKQTVAPAKMVAIEVINRLCGAVSEFALAEHWYASTGLEDLLGVPDGAVTKDRLYRTLDGLPLAKEAIETDLQQRLGSMFELDYDLLLYDLTSSYFEGLAADNDLARRGYSRDHRGDCPQIVLALVVTQEGFPLAHFTLAGNTQDVTTVRDIVTAVERRFGISRRIWVMDRGMASDDNVDFLSQQGRHYLIGAARSQLAEFQSELRSGGWQPLRDEVQVKSVRRGEMTYLLARSGPRRRKERAIRRRQLVGLHGDLKRLAARVAAGRLKDRDKIIERVGRLKQRYPKASGWVAVTVSTGDRAGVNWRWKTQPLKAALGRDGAYLLKSNFHNWTADQMWESYIQLTAAESAFRTLKSELLIRPIWHHYSNRVQAHVMICVLAYALWKTLEHLARQAGLETRIRKPDEEGRPLAATPSSRPMTPAVILRELSQIQIGDIQLETTGGQRLSLRRVSRPNPEQARILSALKLQLPERLSPDRLL